MTTTEFASVGDAQQATHAADAAHRLFRVVIVMPVYQDWESAFLVCRALDQGIARLAHVNVSILLVDDGSPDGVTDWIPFDSHSLLQIDILRLRRNMGHQRAICTGLCYVHGSMPCDAVVVMDADGEDRPEDAVRLIEDGITSETSVLFAERRRRFEGIVFRAGYSLFRLLHRFLTGIPVRVGNFSIISSAALNRLACMPELWNHYAGAVFKSKVRFECIPIDKGRRLRGRSRMNFASLVAHGLAGIASFQEIVATRILIANAVCLAVLLLSLAIVIGIRLFTDLAIPGWATYTVGVIVLLVSQILAVSFSLVFSLISNRSCTAFIPSRDCLAFVDRLDNLARRK